MSDEHDIVEATSRNSEATNLTAATVASNPQETSKKVRFLKFDT